VQAARAGHSPDRCRSAGGPKRGGDGASFPLGPDFSSGSLSGSLGGAPCGTSPAGSGASGLERGAPEGLRPQRRTVRGSRSASSSTSV